MRFASAPFAAAFMSALAVLIVGLGASTSHASQGVIANIGAPYIEVIGAASSQAIADYAIVNASVVSEQSSSAKAKREVDRKVAAFLSELQRIGIAKADIEAANLYTHQKYRDHYNVASRNAPNIFVASRRIKVTVRQLDDLSIVLDGALHIGIGQIRDISYQTTKAEIYESEVRVLAVKDARHKASELADALGYKVGDVWRIDYTNYYGNYSQATATSAESFSNESYKRSSLTFSDRVSVIFLLE